MTRLSPDSLRYQQKASTEICQYLKTSKHMPGEERSRGRGGSGYRDAGGWELLFWSPLEVSARGSSGKPWHEDTLDKDWEDIPTFIYAWLSLNVRWQIMRPGGFIFLVRSRPIFQSFHPSHFGETLGDRVYIKWVVTLSPRKDHLRGGLTWGKQLCFGLFSSSFACILLIVSINICYKIDQECFHF